MVVYVCVCMRVLPKSRPRPSSMRERPDFSTRGACARSEAPMYAGYVRYVRCRISEICRICGVRGTCGICETCGICKICDNCLILYCN